MWGVNLRHIRSRAGNTADINFSPESHAYTNFSLFLQDDIALIPERLRLTLGSKLEKPHFGGTELQPNVRLLWTPNGSNSLWLAASRASRTSSRGETESRVAVAVLQPTAQSYNLPVQLVTVPNPDLEAEKLTAYEIGYRALLTNRLSLDIAAFSNRYRDQSQWNVGTLQLASAPVSHVYRPLSYINAETTTKTRGIEIVADWRPLDWMRLEASHTWLRVTAPAPDGVNTYVAGTSPTRQYALRWTMDLSAKTQFDFWLRRVGKLQSQDQEIPAYTELDIRLGYAVNKNLDLSLVGQNLLDSRHAEFSETSIIPVSYIPRSVYAKATWKF